MAKAKTLKKPQVKEIINPDFIYQPEGIVKIFIYTGIALVSVLLSVYYVYSANIANASYGFPLDDPWIHLTFAKNLVNYHSFSYFKNELATAGSTSPVYTVILAAGFLITNNEMILSYALGIAFLILSGFAFYKLSSFEFGKENLYALLVTGIFVSDKWLNFISVSGMETTMYFFILIACAYFYRRRSAIPFAVFLGLVLWGRPDGIMFIGALAVDYVLVRQFSKPDKSIKLFSKQDFIKIGIIAGVIIALYFGMNLILSGSLLPNTYAAKLEYYKPEFRSRELFLKNEVWNYFTAGAYGIVMLGFVLSLLVTLFDLFKKKYSPNALYIVFIFSMVFIYWLKLPYAHRFGRYFMPLIPFMILLAGIGFRDFSKLAGRYFKSRKLTAGLTSVLLGIIIVLSLGNYYDNKDNYITQCKYISDRHVSAAIWLRDNTQESDVIGTHDVGAIAFYTGRKIVDIAGLITPELITKISEDNYISYITDYMKKSGVTYLALQKEWFRVVNQPPLFSKTTPSPVEKVDVFKFYPDKTHILSRIVNSVIMDAEERLQTRNPQYVQGAVQMLSRSLQYDPNSSLTYLMLAYGSSLMNDNAGTEKNLLKAVELYPDYSEALLQLGAFYKQTKPEESKKYYERYVKLNPADRKVAEQLNAVNKLLKPE